MSAVLPRSKKSKEQPNLSRKSEESCKKKKTQMLGGNMQHSLSGKSQQELAATGSHPWTGFAEALLQPLPPDWRHNIQQAFSNLGEALGKLLGDGQQRQRVGGRRF